MCRNNILLLLLLQVSLCTRSICTNDEKEELYQRDVLHSTSRMWWMVMAAAEETKFCLNK